MSDEFDGLPGASDEASQGEPWTADDKLAGRKINLDDLPEFRAVKSSYDRKIAQLQQQLDQAVREARISQARAQQIQAAINSLDPSAGETLAQAAQIAEMQAELQSYREFVAQLQEQQRREQQVQEFRRSSEELARRWGVDPYDPRIQSAIDRALETGDRYAVVDALRDMVAGAASPMSGEIHQTNEPPRPATSYPLPPAGGSPASVQHEQQKLREAYERDVQLARRRGEYTRVADIRRAYRERGLDI